MLRKFKVIIATIFCVAVVFFAAISIVDVYTRLYRQKGSISLLEELLVGTSRIHACQVLVRKGYKELGDDMSEGIAFPPSKFDDVDSDFFWVSHLSMLRIEHKNDIIMGIDVRKIEWE